MSRIRTVFLADPSVPAYINVCTVDEDIPEYKYDGTDKAYVLASVAEAKSKKAKTKLDKGNTDVEEEILEWIEWTPEDWKRVLVAPEGLVMGMNYGFDKLRFLAPVKSGKRVRCHSEIANIQQKDDKRFLITQAITVEIEGEEKPALVAEWLNMLFLD